jgi:hypothetical protein
MDNKLSKDWKAFREELHKAINTYGAANVELVRDTAIYAAVDGKAVTERYDTEVLSIREIGIWRHDLGLRQ